MRIVLASGSRWRRELLQSAGISCESRTSGVDEHACQERRPRELARELARQKAMAVAAHETDALVIGADQVMELDGDAFGKPADPADHLAQLKRLRGREHALIVGVALVGAGRTVVFDETTRVRFRADLSDAELQAYVDSGEGAGCAGGYEAERRGAQLIHSIDGDWNNVIGLPIFRLVTELRALGWRPWGGQ